MADDKLDLVLNVATTIDVKYCDVVPSRHPEKYPAQVKFKGTSDGQPAVLYLDTPDVLQCLYAARAISEIPPHANADLPAKGNSLRLLVSRLTILRAQKPKEKKITLSINGATADQAPTQPSMARTGEHQSPANGNGNGSREKNSAVYKRMTEWMFTDIVPIYERNKRTVTGADVERMVATVFNAETRH